LCLIPLTSALHSIYGYSHNGAQTRSGTDNDYPLTRSTTGSCTTTTDNTIKCSNIPQDTGEFVARYINTHSSKVSTCSYERQYKNYRQHYMTLKVRLNLKKNVGLNNLNISSLHLTDSLPFAWDNTMVRST